MKVESIDFFDDRFYKITYEKDKKEVVDYFASVTTKLGALAKPFLTRWYGDLGTREAKLRAMEAADRGSRVHYGWQIYLLKGAVIYNNNKNPSYTSQQINEIDKENEGKTAILYSQEEMLSMYKMQQWDKIVNPKLMATEKTLYSMKYRDAGTADTIFEIKEGEYLVNGNKPLRIKGGNYIHDLKTGKSIGNDSKMQVSCYLKMAEEMGIAKFEGALITHTQAKIKTGIAGLATILLTREDVEKYYNDYRNIASVWDSQFGTLKPKIFKIPTLIKR